MDKIWFLCEESFISGPFDTDTLKSKLSCGEVSINAKVWWKGQRDWIHLKDWTENYESYEKALLYQEDAIWFAEKENQTQGPITKSQLIDLLSSLSNLSKIRIWKKGQENWASVYQHADISEELGITRRKFPRAPILGEVVIEKKNGQQFYGKAATISAGGLGIVGNCGLQDGEKVNITFRSPLLVVPVHASAEVKHITNSYCGLEFETISNEQQSTIVDYVRQFEGPSSQYLKSVS